MCAEMLYSLLRISPKVRRNKFVKRKFGKNAVLIDCVDIDKRLATMEQSLDLAAGKLSQQWKTLSGGDRQRAVIGCALIIASLSVSSAVEDKDGDDLQLQVSDRVSHAGARKQRRGTGCIFWLDVPTAACEARTSYLVEQALVGSGNTLVVITHDQLQARRIAHKRLVLDTAVIVSDV
jgi:ABC-type lipoprotein export system ATPase subunit